MSKKNSLLSVGSARTHVGLVGELRIDVESHPAKERHGAPEFAGPQAPMTRQGKNLACELQERDFLAMLQFREEQGVGKSVRVLHWARCMVVGIKRACGCVEA